MSDIRTSQNPGISGLALSLTTTETIFVQNLSGLAYSQGDLLYYDGTNLTNLGAGTAGDVLTTNGVDANPSWTVPVSGGVSSVNTQTGAVVLTTADISEVTNLYYTDARVSANATVVGKENSLGNPTTDGDILSSTIAGVRSWIAPSTGGTPGGSTTQLQFNDAGVFGGASGITWDKTNLVTTIQNATDTASNQSLVIKGANRATPAVGDTVYQSFYQKNSVGTFIESGRLSTTIQDVTSGSEIGTVILSIVEAGTLQTKVKYEDTNIGFYSGGNNFANFSYGFANAIPTGGSFRISDIACDNGMSRYSYGINGQAGVGNAFLVNGQASLGQFVVNSNSYTLGVVNETTFDMVSGSNTITTPASSASNLIAGLGLLSKTIVQGTGSTLINTAALYIDGAYTATVSGANYAIWVNSGATKLGGTLDVTGAITLGTPLSDASIASSATWNGKIANLVEDTTPQLGGQLDAQANSISFTLQTYSPTATTSSTWATATAYALTNIAMPSTLNGYYYDCTTAGTSAATEPTWGTTVGGTTTDNNSLVWATATDLALGYMGVPTTVNGFNYEITTAGITAATEPTWPTVAGNTITDNVGTSAWAGSTAYALSDIAVPSTTNGYTYEITTAGTSGITEPVWPTTAGGTITDNVGIATWAVSVAYALVDLVVPTTVNGYTYECTVAGTSDAATEPTWPTVVGDTVVDGTVTWTCRAQPIWTCRIQAIWTCRAQPVWTTKSTPQTIDLTKGEKQELTMPASNATLTFTAPTGSASFSLIVNQDSVGGRTLTYPANVKWVGGTAPTLSTAASAIDVLSFLFDGVSYYGMGSIGFA